MPTTASHTARTRQSHLHLVPSRTTAATWTSVIALVSPGHVTVFDPTQAALPELMALAGPDDDPCDSDFWVDIETADITGLTTRIAHAIPIRAWSRSHVAGPWQHYPLPTTHT